jgi:hypothetical protein
MPAWPFVFYCLAAKIEIPGVNGRFRRKAVVAQANRKQLRCNVHSDLNRLSTTGRLWCADVAPRVSIDCCHPVAAAGRRAGCAGSLTAGATLARIRLPAGLSAATE